MNKAAKEHEKCPVCHGNWGGKGVRYSEYSKGSQLLRKYYKCDTCGHNFSRDFTPAQPKVEFHTTEVQSHDVTLETRLPNRQKRSTPRKSKSQQ